MVKMYEIPVVVPYRLDLTVSVLRRLSANIVDLLTPEGQYVRALAVSPAPVVVRVTQNRQNSLSAAIKGDTNNEAKVLGRVREMLGCDHDLMDFEQSAATIPWLTPLVQRMQGVKPPRYPTLWEACVNAIVFQQLSLASATAIMRRLIVALGQSVKAEGILVPLHVFPPVESFSRASDDLLRQTGLSSSKIATLRRVAEALTSGRIDTAKLEQCKSPSAATILCQIKGIGPWTAAVILLRGLGRLDVFPANDTSVASNIALVSGTATCDTKSLLDTLGRQRGMLYFYLLLARLESRGEIGRPSFERP
jgi:DNA-3-methyladenine glycosylase II